MKKVLLYGTNKENLNKMLLLLRKDGVLVHFLKNDDLHRVLLEVLEDDENVEHEEAVYDMSLCLFAGYSKDEIYETIRIFTDEKIDKPVFATVTQNNINWKIGRLLVDVNQEHMEMQKLQPQKESK